MLGRCANLNIHMKLDAGNAKRTTWHSICAYPATHTKMNGHVHNTFATQDEIKDSKDDIENIRGRGREKMLKKLNEVYGLFSSIYFLEQLLLLTFLRYFLCLSIRVTDNNKFDSLCVWNLRWLIQRWPRTCLKYHKTTSFPKRTKYHNNGLKKLFIQLFSQIIRIITDFLVIRFSNIKI